MTDEKNQCSDSDNPRAEAVPDALAYDLLRHLQERRAVRLARVQVAEFAKDPRRQVATVLLGPEGDDLGLLAAFGLAVACNERTACVAVLRSLAIELRSAAVDAELAGLRGQAARQRLRELARDLEDRFRDAVAGARGPVERRELVLPDLLSRSRPGR